MANPRRTRFSRRVPDHVTNELVAVLSNKATFGFKDLFVVVYENLKARNAVSGGEEMLRLRAYEKLQNLVTRGLVNKEGKQYTALANIKDAITEAAPKPVIAVPEPVKPVEKPVTKEAPKPRAKAAPKPRAKTTTKTAAKARTKPKARTKTVAKARTRKPAAK